MLRPAVDDGDELHPGHAVDDLVGHAAAHEARSHQGDPDGPSFGGTLLERVVDEDHAETSCNMPARSAWFRSARSAQEASLMLISEMGTGHSRPRVGIVPAQATLGGRLVGATHLVGHLGVVDEGLVAVGEVRRHVECATVLRGQLDRYVLTPGVGYPDACRR